jgi:sec-independent protein translocase protein TatA
MMGFDNPTHIAFILILVLLVFGAKRLPEMGHSLGTGLRGFKEAIGGEATHLPFATDEQPQPVQVVDAQPDVTQPIGSQPFAAQSAPVQSSAPVASVPDDYAA